MILQVQEASSLKTVKKCSGTRLAGRVGTVEELGEVDELVKYQRRLFERGKQEDKAEDTGLWSSSESISEGTAAIITGGRVYTENFNRGHKGEV